MQKTRIQLAHQHRYSLPTIDVLYAFSKSSRRLVGTLTSWYFMTYSVRFRIVPPLGRHRVIIHIDIRSTLLYCKARNMRGLSHSGNMVCNHVIHYPPSCPLLVLNARLFGIIQLSRSLGPVNPLTTDIADLRNLNQHKRSESDPEEGGSIPSTGKFSLPMDELVHHCLRELAFDGDLGEFFYVILEDGGRAGSNLLVGVVSANRISPLDSRMPPFATPRLCC